MIEYAQHEMEDAHSTDENASLNTDKHGNVVLTEARVESTIDVPPASMNWINYVSSDVIGSYNVLTDRWLNIYDFTWSKNDNQDKQLFSLDLPSAVFTPNSAAVIYQNKNMPNLIPFRVHRYCKLDMEIKIQINSNKFQIGQLQCSWWYQPNDDANFESRNNIWTASQNHHVLINASSSNEATLYIPYKHHLPLIHTKKRSDIQNALVIGKLCVRVLNPLSVAVNGPGECYGSVFVRFVNASFTGMLSGEIDSAVPEMDTIAKAALGALNAVASTAPNEDNPPDVSAPSYLVPLAAHSWAAGTGLVEPLNALRLDNKGRTSHPDNPDDECKILNVCRVFGLVSTIEWSKNSSAGELLLSLEASPIMKLERYQSFSPGKGAQRLKSYALPPVAVMASLFAQWRGSLELRFDVVASQFHTGRLVVAYIPGVSADDTVWLGQAIASPHVVFTLQEAASFTFTIPFIANKPFWLRSLTGNFIQDSVLAPSCIKMYILNPLIPMESVTDKVFINVYMRAGNDFELAVPVQPSLGLNWNDAVIYPRSEQIGALTGYFPYYVGTWHTVGDSIAVMRWGSASDQVAEFDPKYLKLMEVDAKKKADDPTKNWIGYYYQFLDNLGPKYYDDSSKTLKPLEFGVVVWGSSARTYTIMLGCADEARAKRAAEVQYLNWTKPGDFSYMASQVLKVSSTSSNTWTNGNPVLIPKEWIHRNKRSTDFVMIEHAEPEGEREQATTALSPTSSFMSTGNGSLLYGESFVDLKDLCRRYQRYAEVTINPGDQVYRNQCSMLIPVVPTGLNLALGTPSQPDEMDNRCRDGHICLIASGYRYFRGSIRIRIIAPHINLRMWVQHRPDRKLSSLDVRKCTSVDTAQAVLNHSYAMYIQDLSVNSIVELEVPFYQPSCFCLLQKPKIVSTEEAFFYTLGDLAIGFFFDDSQIKKAATFPLRVYYSFADDAQLSMFQGFAPMVVLDEIAEPQMGLVENILGRVTSRVESTVREEISTRVDPVVAEASSAVNDLKERLTGAGLSDVFENPTIRVMFSQMAHIIANGSIKSLAIGLVSMLVELKICITEKMMIMTEYVERILRRVQLVANESGNEHKRPDVAEVATHQMETHDVEAATGIITILWSGLCSLLAIRAHCPKDITSLHRFLVKDISGVMKSSNCFFIFLRNILSCADSMRQRIVGIVSPKFKVANLYSEAYPELSGWAHEVVELDDPVFMNKNKFKLAFKNRVDLAYLKGSIYFRNLVNMENREVSNMITRLYEKIRSIRDAMLLTGSDSYIRKEPFVVWQYGEAGVGKSTLATQICLDLLKDRRIKPDVPPIYNHEASSQFWDSCQGNPVMMVDDMFNVQQGEIFERHLSLLFSVVSPAVLCPPKAHLDDKGMTYNPDIFWMNSNYAWCRFTGVDANAVNRRRHFMFEAVLSTIVKKGCPHCDIEGDVKTFVPIADCDPSWLKDNHHLLFYIIVDPLNAKSAKDGPYEYPAFMKLLKEKFHKVADKNEVMYRSRLEQVEELLRDSIDEEDGLDSLEDRVSIYVKKQKNMIEKMVQGSLMPLAQRKFSKTMDDVILYAKSLLGNRFSVAPLLLNPFSSIKIGTMRIFGASAEHEGDDAIDCVLSIYNHAKAKALVNEGVIRVRDDLIYLTEYLNAKGLKPEESSAVVPDWLRQCRAVMQASPQSDVSAVQLCKFLGLTTELARLPSRPEDVLRALYEQDAGDVARTLRRCFDDVKCVCKHLTSVCDPAICTYDKENIYLSDGSKLDLECVSCDSGCSDAACVKQCFWGNNAFKYLWFERFLFYNPQMSCSMKSKLVRVNRHIPTVLRSRAVFDFPDEPKWREWCEKAQNIAMAAVNALSKGFSMFCSAVKWLLRMMAVFAPVLLAVGLISLSVATIMKTPVQQKNAWGAPESHGYQNTQNVNLNARVPVAVAQSESPQLDVCIDRIIANFFKITAVFDDKKLQATGVVLGDRKLLLIRHMLEEFDSLPANTEFYGKFPFSRFLEGQHGVRFNLRDLKRTAYGTNIQGHPISSNFVIVYLPLEFPQCKDLTRFIAKANDHVVFRGEGILVQNNGRVHQNITVVREKTPLIVQSIGNSSEVLLEDKYTYPFHGKGVCGSILLCRNSERPIMGIHVAGIEYGNERGVAELLTMETFRDVPKDPKQMYEKAVLPDLTDAEFAKIKINSLIFPYGCTDSTMTAFQGSETQYVPSLVHGVFDVRTEPNPLATGDPRLPEGCSPLAEGVANLGKPPLSFEETQLKECSADLRNVILQNVKPVRGHVGVVDLETVVCGTNKYPHFEPLEWSTSPGFPLRFMKDAPTQSGKKWLFDLEETPQGYALKGLHPKLAQQLQVDDAMRKRSIKPFTVFIDCLKDTCLPKEKCKIPGKTRIFSISPVQFTIHFKQYFLDFLASYQHARFNAEHAIGIDVNSYEWTQLATVLSSRGCKIICGDYKNFGPGLMLSVARECFAIIMDWYEYHGDGQNNAYRWILAAEVLESPHLCQNLIYMVAAGIASGSPITTPLNSMSNCLYLRYIWLDITKSPEFISYNSMTKFHAHCKVVTYGDDVAISVSDEAAPFYNTQSMHDAFRKYMIVFTDADKTGSIVKWRSLATASFLKNEFHPHPKRKGVFLAALDKVSIEGCANWINRRNNLREATVQNCEQALLLAHGWGEKYYNSVMRRLTAACVEQQLTFRCDTWDSLDRARYGTGTLTRINPITTANNASTLVY